MRGGQATEDGKRCLSSEQIPLIRSQDGLGKRGVFHPDEKGAPRSLSTRVTHQVCMFFKHQSCLYNNAQPLPICSGCHDRPSQTGRLNHRASLVRSPRGWKSKIKVFAGVVSPRCADAPPSASSYGLPSACACPEALVWTDKDFLQGRPPDWMGAHPTSLLLTEAPPQVSVSKYDMGARASTNDIGHSAACNTPHQKKKKKIFPQSYVESFNSRGRHWTDLIIPTFRWGNRSERCWRVWGNSRALTSHVNTPSQQPSGRFRLLWGLGHRVCAHQELQLWPLPPHPSPPEEGIMALKYLILRKMLHLFMMKSCSCFSLRNFPFASCPFPF